MPCPAPQLAENEGITKFSCICSYLEVALSRCSITYMCFFTNTHTDGVSLHSTSHKQTIMFRFASPRYSKSLSLTVQGRNRVCLPYISALSQIGSPLPGLLRYIWGTLWYGHGPLNFTSCLNMRGLYFTEMLCMKEGLWRCNQVNQFSHRHVFRGQEIQIWIAKEKTGMSSIMKASWKLQKSLQESRCVYVRQGNGNPLNTIKVCTDIPANQYRGQPDIFSLDKSQGGQMFNRKWTRGEVWGQSVDKELSLLLSWPEWK